MRGRLIGCRKILNGEGRQSFQRPALPPPSKEASFQQINRLSGF